MGFPIHDFTPLRYTPYNNNTTPPQPKNFKTKTTRSKCSSPPSSLPSSPSRPLPLLSMSPYDGSFPSIEQNSNNPQGTTAPPHLALPWVPPPPPALAPTRPPAPSTTAPTTSPAPLSASSLLAVSPLLCKDPDQRFFKA